jgi:L-lysine 6-transaminase
VHANDALFILDEVQTGVGTTGTAWAYQQLGIQPDVVAFSKKAQIGGIMAGGRVDEVPDNVFKVSGRINSTWGGGLVDMVRSQRALEIIESEGLIEQAGPKGERLIAGLEMLRDDSGLISNVRGRGLFVAFDLESREERDAVVTDLRVEERVIVLPCGERSIRFRPALSVSQDEIDEALGATRRSVVRIASKELQYS